MTAADLIYDALLRAERRLEAIIDESPAGSARAAELSSALIAVEVIREEIGSGLAAERI